MSHQDEAAAPLNPPAAKPESASGNTATAYFDAENQRPGHGQNQPSVARLASRCCASMPTLWAHYILRPLGIVRPSSLIKLLVFLASIYMIVVTSLYMLGSEYLPFPSERGGGISGGSGSTFSSPVPGNSRLHPAIPPRPNQHKEEWSGFDPHEAYDKMINDPADEQTFSWYDWVDTRQVRKLWDAMNKGGFWGSGGQDDESNPFDDMRFPPNRGKSDTEQAMNGRHYLDQYMAPPKKVIFVGKPSRTVKIISRQEAEKRKQQQGEKPEEQAKLKAKQDVENDKNTETMDAKAKEMENLEKGKRDAKAKPTGKAGDAAGDAIFPQMAKPRLEDKIAIDLPWESFLFDPVEQAEKYEEEHPDDPEYTEHAKMLRLASEHVKTSGKHFHEVPLKKGFGSGIHYDWRFFNKVRHGRDHESFMHHLIRAWSMFTNEQNIMSWIAHGSLIGWYWDGMAMPWDADNDVQMPIQELDRFARKFNQSLIVEDPTEGNGRYFIDVGPWYVQRERGNGANVIDARFIDVRSGIYLDITGLAATGKGFEEKKANCKNWHTYHISQLSPARRTLYEGVQVFVPNAFESVLGQEYKGFRKSNHDGYTFWRHLRLWAKTDQCKKFSDKSKQFDSNRDLTRYGACNSNDLWGEYNRTKEVTAEHGREFDLYSELQQLSDPGDYNRTEDEADSYSDLHQLAGPGEDFIDPKKEKALYKEFAQTMNGYYPPLRYDPL